MTRPCSVLHVGITGHRLDKLRARDIEPLRERLADLLAVIEAAVLRRLASPPGGGPRCRLVSALAEGADRLAIDAAPPHWPIAALLPMPRELYRQDFLTAGQSASPSCEAFETYLARAETVTELPMASPTADDERRHRDAQYAALGRALVRRIDCLVAVWDGKPPAGPGGTANVVEEAVRLRLPVLWLDPAKATRPRRILRFQADDITRPVLSPLDGGGLDAMLDDAFSRCRTASS